MAQGARLEEARLVVERRRPRRTAETGSRVALQAEQIDVAHLQHVCVRTAVNHVARLAPVGFHWNVLVHKGALLVDVALKADHILRSSRSDLLRLGGPVRVVAIRALNQVLVHAVVKRHGELGLLGQVARVAKLRLGFQKKEPRLRSMMG